ncbi:MAG: hypothetical protein ACTSU5_11470 [Promethearchaeota archaeon]
MTVTSDSRGEREGGARRLGLESFLLVRLPAFFLFYVPNLAFNIAINRFDYALYTAGAYVVLLLLGGVLVSALGRLLREHLSTPPKRFAALFSGSLACWVAMLGLNLPHWRSDSVLLSVLVLLNFTLEGALTAATTAANRVATSSPPPGGSRGAGLRREGRLLALGGLLSAFSYYLVSINYAYWYLVEAGWAFAGLVASVSATRGVHYLAPAEDENVDLAPEFNHTAHQLARFTWLVVLALLLGYYYGPLFWYPRDWAVQFLLLAAWATAAGFLAVQWYRARLARGRDGTNTLTVTSVVLLAAAVAVQATFQPLLTPLVYGIVSAPLGGALGVFVADHSCTRAEYAALGGRAGNHPALVVHLTFVLFVLGGIGGYWLLGYLEGELANGPYYLAAILLVSALIWELAGRFFAHPPIKTLHD